MSKIDYYVPAELEACSVCESAGIFSKLNINNIKRSAEYILTLAEKIKNQRIDQIMQLSGNVFTGDYEKETKEKISKIHMS